LNLKNNYRFDIEGLRAVAVLSVLFYHLGIKGFRGGYVGVDIFFVISGYLITSIIIRDITSETFSIKSFYERRIRRIFPALFFVIGFSFIIASFLYDPKSFKIFGNSVIATTLFIQNINFWKEGGYFDSAGITKPLLHLWSLAIEEQFYLIFPLMLLGLHKLKWNNYIFNFVLFVAGFSLLECIFLSNTHPVFTFYMPITRAWELMFGSIVYFSSITYKEIGYSVKQTLSILGLFLLLFSIIFYHTFATYPSFLALAPVVGSGLIIFSGSSLGFNTYVAVLLSIRPLTYLGQRSYSIYLWHWPLIVFYKYIIIRALAPLEIFCLILLIFIVSIISYKYIEEPIRKKIFLQSREKIFIVSFVTIVLFMMLGFLVNFFKGFPQRYPKASLNFIQNDDLNLMRSQFKTIATLGKIPIIQIGLTNIKSSFLIWGDSHGEVLLPSLNKKSLEYKVSGLCATEGSHPPLLGVDLGYGYFNNEHLSDYNEQVFSFISNHPEIKTVILIGIWSTYLHGHRYNDQKQILLKTIDKNKSVKNYIAFKAGLTLTVSKLNMIGKKVIIIDDVPEIGYDVPKLIWVSNITNQNFDYLIPTLKEYNRWNFEVHDILRNLSIYKSVKIFSPLRYFLNSNGKIKITLNDIPLFGDEDHLSQYGVRFLSPFYDNVFQDIKFNTLN